MIVLSDTTTYDSSIRLVQLVGEVTKVNMLKVCDKLDLYVSPNLKKDETARRVARRTARGFVKQLQVLSRFGRERTERTYSQATSHDGSDEEDNGRMKFYINCYGNKYNFTSCRTW